MPLHVSCPGPVRGLFSSWGGGSAPLSPCLAWSCLPPCGQACFCELAFRARGAARGRHVVPLTCVWGARAWALSHARRPVLGACGRGLLPTGYGCGTCGRGDPSATPQRALLRAGFARCGSGTRAPGGGGDLLPGCGASAVGRSPTRNRPSFGRAAGADYPLAVGAGGVGLGTRHQPHSARSCELALCAVGRHEGTWGGVPLAWVWGRPGLGALPRPTARPRGVRPGPATHRLWVRGVWAWGPVTNPTACAFASWLCALFGRQEGARGECLLPGCGMSAVGRFPSPDRPSLGRAAGAW